VSKPLGWALTAFAVFYLLSNPGGAAHFAASAAHGLQSAAHQLSQFVNKL
jgi:hypothetical protein